ncbi:hypothetical protein BU15DRAFT_62255 [Melanogaster broomeanus]|nr:hypothetical protein BU15DRAFT_62255 [Melanogaster broomeanus]
MSSLTHEVYLYNSMRWAANGTRTDETGSLKLTGLLTGLDYVLMGPSRDKIEPPLMWIPGSSKKPRSRKFLSLLYLFDPTTSAPGSSVATLGFRRGVISSRGLPLHLTRPGELRNPPKAAYMVSKSRISAILCTRLCSHRHDQAQVGRTMGQGPDAILKGQSTWYFPSVARQNVGKQYLHPLVPIPRTTWWASTIHQVSSRHSAPARNHQQKTARVKMTTVEMGPPLTQLLLQDLPLQTAKGLPSLLTPPPPSPPLPSPTPTSPPPPQSPLPTHKRRKRVKPVHAPRPPYKAHSQKIIPGSFQAPTRSLDCFDRFAACFVRLLRSIPLLLV